MVKTIFMQSLCFILLLFNMPVIAQSDTLFTPLANEENYFYFETKNKDLSIETGYLKNGKKLGNHLRYFPNGVFMQLAQYHNGVLHGLKIVCDKSGVVVEEENYFNGKLDGVAKIYTSSKNVRIVKSKIQYKNGLLHGNCIEYNEMGNVVSEQNYEQGKKEGLSKWYFSNNQLAMEQNSVGGVLNGTQKSYNQQGVLVVSGQNEQGKKSGMWQEFYDLGMLKNEGRYHEDQKIGSWINYNELGEEIGREFF